MGTHVDLRGPSLEAIAQRLREALECERHADGQAFHGAPDVLTGDGIVVGVLANPQDAQQVLAALVAHGRDQGYPSRFLMLPKCPAAVYLPLTVRQDLESLAIRLRHSAGRDLEAAARALIAEFASLDIES